MNARDFPNTFKALTGNDPFPWQAALFDRLRSGRDSIPARCDIPTGLGKTAVIAIWLLARQVNSSLPRRLVYVVNRRTVVDQTTDEVERIRENLTKIGRTKADLAISTLRGQFADNREWSTDPSREAVICGTVDMIGSRLLFSGYGVGFKGKPLHAGFLGQDTLIVHDEAHLEPAFQETLVAIEKEQRGGRFKDRFPLRVMELSATSRSQDAGAESNNILTLTDADRANETVRTRIAARKKLHLIPQIDAKPGKQLADLAIKRFKDSGRAILLFTRTIDDVKTISDAIAKANLKFEQLIGPMRGLEREHLLNTGVFKRFLPNVPEDAAPGTVFLVCTSAGEVGVNISADDLVCDLSTFESMAQRFGRVNRFGARDDTEIHVVHPIRPEERKHLPAKPLDIEKKKTETIQTFDEANQLDVRRERTLGLLSQLDHDASPDALSKLAEADRLAAFAPPPIILETSDILFDAWAMTSIRDLMPGRPTVEPYLHGIRDYDPPETQVGWREEVGIITADLLVEYPPADLLDEYPLKPHELLGDRSDRVLKELVKLAERFPNTPTWLVDADGKVMPTTLDQIAQTDGKQLIERKTVLLPHYVGGLSEQGLLDASCPRLPQANKPPAPINNDVADALLNDKNRQVRLRVWNDNPEWDAKTQDMRLILRIDLPPPEDDEDTDGRSWHWFELPLPKENSKNATEPVLLDDHVGDVVRKARDILSSLTLDPEPRRDEKLKYAIIIAAQFHDLGKRRELWQRSIGRPARLAHLWFGKSGRRWRPRDIAEYRHEFGSLVDLQIEEAFRSLDDESKDLVLHLIATHHGQARPHFKSGQTVDPNATTPACEAIAVEVPRRYARLQHKFGRWGLAYIESLLRAADYAASAAPSASFAEDAT